MIHSNETSVIGEIDRKRLRETRKDRYDLSCFDSGNGQYCGKSNIIKYNNDKIHKPFNQIVGCIYDIFKNGLL